MFCYVKRKRMFERNERERTFVKSKNHYCDIMHQEIILLVAIGSTFKHFLYLHISIKEHTNTDNYALQPTT